MNRTIARALLLDAYSQVMDNKVFRLLVLTSIALIAPAFLIGFHGDGISLIFGWKTFTYKEFYGAFGIPTPTVDDVHIYVIQQLQAFIVQFLGGSFGVLFCIAATAFFVPRMLEKGAADILFTKPIARSALLFSRYLAGLIFVGILSFLLVLGIHLGLLVVSGYSDPGFLWSALTLVYIYALVQTVSVVVGVFTRNSVATLLCTVLFFTFNGCVHQIWVAKEHGREVLSSSAGDNPKEALRAKSMEVPFLVFLKMVLDGTHYVLPKTRDADVLTKQLRTIIVGRSQVLQDPAGKLVVERDPEGFTRKSPGDITDLLQSPATWVSRKSEGAEAGKITLSRRSRLVERPPESGSKDEKPRITHQSTGQAATEFLKSLEGRPEIRAPPTKERKSAGRLSFDVVSWQQNAPEGAFARERAFLSVDDWMYELDTRLRPEEPDGTTFGSGAHHFMEAVRVNQDDAQYLDTSEWYEKRFGWSAPLRFNAFFSLFSSIAFAGILLAIAAWRLSRIDF